MNKKYELVVKGINNYGDKVTVTVKPEGDGQASLLLPDVAIREGANKRGNSSRLTQSFHFFMFEPIFSPVNALNQPI